MKVTYSPCKTMLSSQTTFLFESPLLVAVTVALNAVLLSADCRLLFVGGASVVGVGVGFIFNIEEFLPTATKTKQFLI